MNKHILVGASHEKNLDLLASFLEDQGYDARAASTVYEIDEALEEDTVFDMSLIDISGFGDSIWKRCERLRNNSIPFFIISPQKADKRKGKSLKRGARDFLTKPLDKGRLLKLVQLILEE
jgi:DNA-binding response OmpR family regulator